MRYSELLIGKHRIKDSDRDGVPDLFDCQPYNPNKDGLKDIWGKVKEKVKDIITPKQPSPAQPQSTLLTPTKPANTSLSKISPDATPKRAGGVSTTPSPAPPPSPRSSGYSSVTSPTPSASEVAGTPEQREQQIQDYPTQEELKQEVVKIKTVVQYPRDYAVGLITQDVPKTFEQSLIPKPQRTRYPSGTSTYAQTFTPSQERTVKTIQEETIAQVKTEKQIENDINQVYNSYYERLDIQLNNINKRWQEKLDNRLKNVTSEYEWNKVMKEYNNKNIEEQKRLINEYMGKAESDANKIINNYSKLYGVEAKTREKIRNENYKKREDYENFWRKRVADIVTVGAYAIPVYGITLLSTDIAETSYNAPSIVKELATDKYARKEAIASTITMGIAGVGIAKGKAKYKSYKVNEALGMADISARFKGRLREKQIDKLKLTEEQQIEVQNLVNKGYGVRKYDIEVKAKKGYEKYTPEVKGEYLQIVDREGEIVKNVAYGEVEVKLGRKKLKTNDYIESIQKIEKDLKVKGYTEKLSRVKGKSYLTRFYDESEIKSMKKEGKDMIVESETTSRLLGTKKYREEGLTVSKYGKQGDRTIMPNFELLARESKPYSKTIAKEKITQSEIGLAEEVITSEGIEIGRGRIINKVFDTKGFAKVERIKEVKKPKKSYGWAETENPIVNLEYKPTKSFKSKPKQASQLEYPSYVGGEMKVIERGKPDIFMTSLAEDTIFLGAKRITKPLGLSLAGSSLKGLFGLDVSEISDFEKYQFKRKTKEFQKPSQNLLSVQTTPQTFKEFTITNLNLREVQVEAQKEKQKQEFKFAQPTPQIITTPIPPFTKPPFRIKIEYPEEIGKKEKEQGYNSYAYIESTKPKRSYWKQLNEKPLTKLSALSMSARFVDENISSKGKVEVLKEKIGKKLRKEVIDTGDDYYIANKKKFRDYQIKKGKKFKLPNKFIEKREFRLDSPSEVRQISKSRVSKFFGF